MLLVYKALHYNRCGFMSEDSKKKKKRMKKKLENLLECILTVHSVRVIKIFDVKTLEDKYYCVPLTQVT